MPQTTAQPRTPSSVANGSTERRDPEIERILGVSVPVAVTLAERDMTVESLLAVTVGTILEFDVPFDAELSLHVADRVVGKGLAVKVGERFGFRVTRIDNVRDRIEAIGKS